MIMERCSDFAATVAEPLGSAAGEHPKRLLTARVLGRVTYERALAMQESLLAARIAGEASEADLLLLEHEPVYTLGRAADEGDLLGAPASTGAPVFRVGRGGGATFHGPGQLVGYPIVPLGPRREVHGFIRRLEASLIATCAGFGVMARAVEGQTGVWVGGEKIAAIGIGVRRGVTWHGVALNVSTDLSYFAAIVPCRTAGLPMTTLERQLGWSPPLTEVAERFAVCLAAELGASLRWA
jgi:lipoyl(octanoyl) transferase